MQINLNLMEIIPTLQTKRTLKTIAKEKPEEKRASRQSALGYSVSHAEIYRESRGNSFFPMVCACYEATGTEI